MKDPVIEWRAASEPGDPRYVEIKPPFTWRAHSGRPKVRVLCAGRTYRDGRRHDTAIGVVDIDFAPDATPEERERQMQTVHDLCMVRWGDRT